MKNYSTTSKPINDQKSGQTFGRNSYTPFFSPLIQTKLQINEPGDEYEQEADAVADNVMRMTDLSKENLFFKPAITSLQRKCAHCEDEDKVQRKESHTEASTEAYINSFIGGKSLNDTERSFFESAIGHDLSNVRLHTDSAADQSVKKINALAYTHGNDIVFRSGQYQPETDSGKRLLAHELTHVVQQAKGNVSGAVQLAPSQGSYNTPTINTPTLSNVTAANRQIPQGVITRQAFDQYMTNYFGVQTIHTGTQQEQEVSLTRNNAPAPSIPGWQSWDPGTSSEDYSFIIRAIEDVAASFMSVPTIRRIIFYKMHYDPNAAGIGIPDPTVGASFGAGELTIYEGFSRSRAFPVARSNSQGNYPPVGIALTSPGSSGGAPSAYQGRQGNISENIVHELGHGIAEAASAANPTALTDFNAAVGWVGTNPAVLYDIGQPSVQTAIAANTAPPAQYRIDPGQWNNPQWIEQPMTHYSVAGGPGEDFAESIAAYVYATAVLQQRSPRRYQFILNGINTWRSQMRLMPPVKPPVPVGDFPVTEEMRHTA